MYLEEYGGRIVLSKRAGDINNKLGIINNRDFFTWNLSDRRKGDSSYSHSHIYKTQFLLDILPLQHNPSKIKQVLQALTDLRWSNRDRYNTLIPKEHIQKDLFISEGTDLTTLFKS